MTAPLKRFPVPLNLRNGRVDMTHGSGGRSMAQLIDELFVKHFYILLHFSYQVPSMIRESVISFQLRCVGLPHDTPFGHEGPV